MLLDRDTPTKEQHRFTISTDKTSMGTRQVTNYLMDENGPFTPGLSNATPVQDLKKTVKDCLGKLPKGA